MVYVYVPALPSTLSSKFTFTNDPMNPKNYRAFSEIKLYTDAYNNDHVDSD